MRTATIDRSGSVADADSNQEAAFFVKQLKEFVGLGDIDDTAQWVAMTYNDVRRRRVSRRGAVALSVEILPPEEAEDRPAGQGRSEPNANPFLPPTTGRMSRATSRFASTAPTHPSKAAAVDACNKRNRMPPMTRRRRRASARETRGGRRRGDSRARCRAGSRGTRPSRSRRCRRARRSPP